MEMSQLLKKTLLPFVLLFCLVPLGVSAKSFSDVNVNTETGRAIQNLSDRGIISGYSDGTFRPNGYVTRGQAAKIIVGALNTESYEKKFNDSSFSTFFKDIPRSNSYYEYVQAIAELHGINGYDDGTFRPNNKLTRAQVAKILTKSYTVPYYTEKESYFSDVNRNGESYRYITEMNHMGIMQGTSRATFSPNKQVTRAELALYIFRLDQYFVQQFAQANKKVFNAPGSPIAQLYKNHDVMKQTIYYNLPAHSMRQKINDTFTFGEIEGSYCSGYNDFGICHGYSFESNTVHVLGISSDNVTIADFEAVFKRTMRVEGNEMFSTYFYFEHGDMSYRGYTSGKSKSSIVEQLFASPIYY